MRLLRARSNRLAHRNVVVGHTVFPFKGDGITAVFDERRTTREDFEALLRMNQVYPLDGYVPEFMKHQYVENVASSDAQCLVCKKEYSEHPAEFQVSEPSVEKVECDHVPEQRLTAVVCGKCDVVLEAQPRIALPATVKPSVSPPPIPKPEAPPPVKAASMPAAPMEHATEEEIDSVCAVIVADEPLPVVETYALIIEDVPEEARITVYRAIRDELGLDLSSIKHVLTSFPATLLSGVEKADADRAQAAISEAGAKISVILE